MVQIPIPCAVYRGDRRVGVLTLHNDKEQTTAFTYDTAYEGPELPTLPRQKEPVVTQGLPPLFDNMLSERWRSAAEREDLGKHTPFITDSNTLAFFTKDLIGSLSFEPLTALPPETLAAYNFVERKISALNSAHIPGTQPKFLVRQTETGTFIAAPSGGSTHIAKHLSKQDLLDTLLHKSSFGGEVFNAPHFNNILKNEFVATEVLRALLPKDQTTEAVFQSFQNIPGDVLFLKRFDRTEDGKPIEFYEFNQLLNKTPDQKGMGSYKDLADYIYAHASGKTSDGIKTDRRDIDVLFKRLLASILIENRDTHLKNFGLLRSNDNVFRLAPNYDIVPWSQYKEFRHIALAIGGHNNPKGHKNYKVPDLEARHIVFLAEDFGLLSKTPNDKEIAHVLKLVDEVATQAQKVSRALKTGDTKAFPNFEKIMTPRFKDECDAIAVSIDKRRNATLVGIPFFLAKRARNKAPQKPKRTPHTPKNLAHTL